MAEILRVYVPGDDSDLWNRIDRGSGIVGSAVGESGRLRIDFEGDDEIFPAYKDRVERAAERHLHARSVEAGRGYATRACAYVDPVEVIEIGCWDHDRRELEIRNQDALEIWTSRRDG